jgi:hypothetical protein
MRISIYIVLLSLLVFGCQKQKTQLKRINGMWEVKLVRVLDGEGFTFYDSIPQGTLEINSEIKNITGRVDFDYNFFGINQVQDSFVVEQAHFDMSEDGAHLIVQRATDTIDIRVLLSSKNELEFEYYDFQQYRLRRFALRKL